VSYWLKIADYNLPRLCLAPSLGWLRWNFTQIFGISKQSLFCRMALFALS